MEWLLFIFSKSSLVYEWKEVTLLPGPTAQNGDTVEKDQSEGTVGGGAKGLWVWGSE